MKSFDLGDNITIPALGFGTWQLQGQTCVDSVKNALEVGYRHIDTADGYGNHREVAAGIKKSGIKREDLFITTKIPRDNLSQQGVLDSCKRYLAELQTEYIDLLLIHWPNQEIPIEESLSAFESLRTQGLIKAVGVSNFTIKLLGEALNTGVKINNNQVEYHPSLNQEELLAFCKDKGIVVTAYSPIARKEDLGLSIVQDLAQKYGRSPAQVILNWIISKGMVAIPKSGNPDHIRDNFKTLSWELKEEDIKKVDQINQKNRVVNPSFAQFED